MVGDHGCAVAVVVADEAIQLQSHGVAGGVKGLGADDDLVVAEPVELIPGPGVAPPKQGQDLLEGQTESEENGVFPIGGEDDVAGSEGVSGADLRGLLAEGRRPQAEFAVPLQGRGLGIEPPCQHHVPKVLGQVVVGSLEGELGVLDALPIGGQQLHHVVFHDLS